MEIVVLSAAVELVVVMKQRASFDSDLSVLVASMSGVLETTATIPIPTYFSTKDGR